jgi:hypothetical protein
MTMDKDEPRLVFCTYEDRAAEFVRVALLSKSLLANEPGATLQVFGRCVPDWFYEFAGQESRLAVGGAETLSSSGWCVKPEVLRRMIAEHGGRVTWIDSDIVVSAPVRALFATRPDEELLVAEEPACNRGRLQGAMAELWGLKPGRGVSARVNSCVVSATEQHLEVLQAWEQLMQQPAFLEAQEQRYKDRESHLASDQEVLEAVLTSAPGRNVPVQMLKSGEDIAQCFRGDGYSVGARLRHLWGRLPPLVHAQGSKPWDAVMRPKSAYLDVSPYLYVARKYREGLPDECRWMFASKVVPRTLEIMTGGEPNLVGLPYALRSAIVRWLRRM